MASPDPRLATFILTQTNIEVYKDDRIQPDISLSDLAKTEPIGKTNGGMTTSGIMYIK
jgi:hypothetical protein